MISTRSGNLVLLDPGFVAHSVDSPVDNRQVHVDAMWPTSTVHLGAVVVHRLAPVSSTGPKLIRASDSGDCETLSPASTDAKTTDEKLNFMMGRTQSIHAVDSGDIHVRPITVGLVRGGGAQ